MIRRGQHPTPSRVFSAFTVDPAASSDEHGEGEHPCTSCIAPCCTTVTLHEFEPQTFRDVDYLGYLVGFERIELGWLPSGTVEINYRAFCNHFDRRTARCKVHGTEAQPLMCTEYDAHQCTYKSQFLDDQGADMIRVSAERFEYVAKQFSYDIKGTIVKRPTFGEVGDSLDKNKQKEILDAEKKPYRPTSKPFPNPEGPPSAESIPHTELRTDPCAGCAAHCCKVLIFPLPPPSTRQEVSFYRYIAGFPGLEIAVTPRGYVVQCFSRCKHLSSKNRCELFGEPNRPIFCTSYDPWNCSFVPTYEYGTSLLRRFNLEEWAVVESLFQYGKGDGVTHIPVYEDVITILESEET